MQRTETHTAMTGPRLLLQQLRTTLSGMGSAHARLQRAVEVIAENMQAEVCSAYVIRAGALELFATKGLNLAEIHRTRFSLDEGLVGRIATLMMPVALSDAQADPAFALRKELGEEAYRSLMGVPIVRGGRVVGVVVVQNVTERHYDEDEVEAMQTIAMVLAEMVDTLTAEAPGSDATAADSLPARLTGVSLNQGLARGIAVFHQARIVVEKHVADDIEWERRRLTDAITDLRNEVDRLLERRDLGIGAESLEILEAYRMFAHDRGWLVRLQAAIDSGLTAEAAVERVQIENTSRLQAVRDPVLRERQQDLDDLAHRLLRHLTGAAAWAVDAGLPESAVIVARNMGPAELLDYPTERIKALALEEGGPTAHVAIVARALQIPVVGRIDNLLQTVDPDDLLFVDGDNGLVFVRPGAEVQDNLQQSIRLREAQQAQYAALKDAPAQTLDNVQVSLNINAGLLADLSHLHTTGAAGIGLYRTELHFMVRSTLPSVAQQRAFYTEVLNQAGDKPVMFRTLDVGGDKMLPYMRRNDEENPAMGWRAIRLALERPGLLRVQLRALLQAAAGGSLNLMFPMIAEISEFTAAKALLDREIARATKLNQPIPAQVRVGTMLEVPSLVWRLQQLLPIVDFVSIGSNDLLQFLFASDRGNPRVANRYDLLSPVALSFLKYVVRRCAAAGVPVSLCGEAAGQPTEAMALLGIGLRNISMSASSIGPVKMMVRSLDLGRLEAHMDSLLELNVQSLRPQLTQFAHANNVIVELPNPALG